jgi:hypothetical protein
MSYSLSAAPSRISPASLADGLVFLPVRFRRLFFTDVLSIVVEVVLLGGFAPFSSR